VTDTAYIQHIYGQMMVRSCFDVTLYVNCLWATLCVVLQSQKNECCNIKNASVQSHLKVLPLNDLYGMLTAFVIWWER